MPSPCRKQLHDVLDDLHRDVIDVRVEVSFRRRSYNGSRSSTTCRFRIVGVWNDDAEKYHLYVTNLSVADYSASDIAQLYRARWEVELLFKELKSTYNLDQIPTSNPVAVEALILVALISLVVSRVLLDLLEEIVNQDIRYFPVDQRQASVLPRSSHRMMPDSATDLPTSGLTLLVSPLEC